jgi:hypothetical protein
MRSASQLLTAARPAMPKPSKKAASPVGPTAAARRSAALM